MCGRCTCVALFPVVAGRHVRVRRRRLLAAAAHWWAAPRSCCILFVRRIRMRLKRRVVVVKSKSKPNPQGRCIAGSEVMRIAVATLLGWDGCDPYKERLYPLCFELDHATGIIYLSRTALISVYTSTQSCSKHSITAEPIVLHSTPQAVA